MKALHCYKPVERQSKLIDLLASMCTYEIQFSVNELTGSTAERTDEDAVGSRQVTVVTYTHLYHGLYGSTSCYISHWP